MKSKIASRVLVSILGLASAARAQECPKNAFNPKAVKATYDAQHDLLFKPGPDGVLHALDAQTNSELWAYTPPDLDTTRRADGLMTDVRVLRFDANSNGVIEPGAGDRVWVYVGLRRGGRYYYALDATERTRVQLLWKIGPAELPGVGETWSTPTLARVKVAGVTQNGEHLVVILGGGYDETLPSAHRIYIVDAATGHLLWYAGGPGGIEIPRPPDLALSAMVDPVSARIAALDTDGDLFADRLYIADLGGRVWRFDIWNGRDREQLVTGGVFANLGATATGAVLPSDARRFFHAPDVALIQHRGAGPYFNLAIGSGDRANPFDALAHDRFYSLRDRNPFMPISQSMYDALTPVTDDNLFDITDGVGTAAVPTSASGWRLDLRLNGGWFGEKALVEALTVDGIILFTTYQPPSDASSCSAGINRVYALRADNGDPAIDFNDDGIVTTTDAAMHLTQTGIAGEVNLIIPSHANPNGTDPGGIPTPPGEERPDVRVQCAVGAEAMHACVTSEGLLRTFWRRDSIN